VSYPEGKITKDLLKGIALSSLICLASIYIPVLGFLFALFIPLPVLFYRSKLGRKSGIVIFAATILVIAVVVRNFSIDLIFFCGTSVFGLYAE